MIKKTLVTALIIFTIYNLAAPFLIPKVKVAQHQWQKNKIKAQNFIYNDSDTVNSVIVGSSLSARIVTDSLSGYYNLAFDGQSIFDGLNILSKKEHLPKNIFIETNVLLRNEDTQFASFLFDPYFYYTKQYLPALREGREPLAITGALMSRGLREITGNMIVKIPDSENKDVNKPAKNDVYQKLLAGQFENYSQSIDTLLLKKNINQLNQYVKIFQKKHIRIVFFEIAVDSSLYMLPLSKTIRRFMNDTFPQNSFLYIKPPKDTYFQTADGIHLIPQEALKYTLYFNREAKI